MSRVLGPVQRGDDLSVLERRALQAVIEAGTIAKAGDLLGYSYHYLRDVLTTARYKLAVRTTQDALVRGLREGWLE